MTLSDFEFEMAKRLIEFRESLKIKQKQVAIGSETAQSHLSDMEKGKKQIQPRVIFYLSETYGLNINWLYTGRGEMFREDAAGMTMVAESQAKYKRDTLKKLEREVAELQKWKQKIEHRK